MDNVLLKHAAGNAAVVCDVFGSWDLRPSGWEDNGVARGDYADRDEEVHHSEPWSQDTVNIREYDDLNSLSEYHRAGVDWRQEQLSTFIRLREESGEITAGGRSVLAQSYSKKEINGTPLGRRYARGVSAQCITTEARAASRPKDAYVLV